jgi:AraC-like DNA-binding protein
MPTQVRILLPPSSRQRARRHDQSRAPRLLDLDAEGHDATQAPLETGGAPIEEISWAVGYEDPPSFRRLFKRITGLAPGEYRRRFALPDLPLLPAAEPPAVASTGQPA